ncbi:VPLPA-CTERM sorting domain-containing protein [Sneathiella glossodoripedis]|uniref:VPLPA-CTERM sorting domain-containing protein n=1 Tax=Sneathiella glossodoripedis TaxID=418853 RepID=UPI00056C0F09|nr:VPLPA-CTERM sorting domain-containing protein [Sneathiella glossodoripedis]
MYLKWMAILLTLPFLLSPAVAGAGVIYFSDGYGEIIDGVYNSPTVDGVFVTAKATAYDAGVPVNAALNQDFDGLGVDATSGDPNIDFKGPKEGIKLAFSKPVLLTELMFTNDDDAFSQDYSFDLNFDGAIVYGNGIFDAYEDYEYLGYGSYIFTTGILINYMIEIMNSNIDTSYRLYGVRYSTSAVPLPPAILLFGAALAGLGWFRRRKMGQA